jgi:hypothetical protein
MFYVGIRALRWAGVLVCVYAHTHKYIYILKASRVLGNVTEPTISLVVITGRVPRRRLGTDISYTL